MILDAIVAHKRGEVAQKRENLAKRIIYGYDLIPVQRPQGSQKTAREIISDWVEERIAAFGKQEGNAK